MVAIKIKDNSGDQKYFAMIPYYIVNHSTAYEQSLYLVMKRIASEGGTCWASPATIAKMMGTSANTVRKYLKNLVKRGWIKKIGKRGKTKPTDEYEIVDLWKLNIQFYQKENSGDEQSQKESSTGEESKGEKVQQVKKESSSVGNKEESFIKDNNTSVKKMESEIESIYSIYPSKDIYNNNRSTGKSHKAKMKIKKILIANNYPLLKATELYINHCAAKRQYMQNFNTFLNNLPDPETLKDYETEKKEDITEWL